MADYADDAAALLDALDWPSAHVVGSSFGGMVAQHLALRHPERVNRMVLACTSPGGLLPSFPLHELEKLDVEARIELKLGLLDNRWDPANDDPIPDLNSLYDILVAQMREEPDAERARGERLQLEARADHDTSNQLHKITAPTLICAGEYDDQAPLPNSQALAERIPGARLRVFHGGHLFMIQDPQAFPAMIKFLSCG